MINALSFSELYSSGRDNDTAGTAAGKGRAKAKAKKRNGEKPSVNIVARVHKTIARARSSAR